MDVGGPAEVAPTVKLLDTAENNVRTHKIEDDLKRFYIVFFGFFVGG